MTGWQAAALGLAIWALAVGFILGLVAAGTRKAAPKLYDPQTLEPSFWADPADETKTRKRPAR